MKKEKVSWKYALIMSMGPILAMAFFLFTRYKLNGYLYRSDWIIAVAVIILGSFAVFLKAYLDNRNKKGTDNE